MQPIGIGDLLWLLFLFLAFQPMLRQRMIEAARLRLMREIERKRGTRVIAMIHRQETMGFLGFPLFRYIDVHDAEEVIRAIRETDPAMPIDLVLHTPGGLVLAATQIAEAVRAHPGRVTVVVPHYAMSGGTLIALAADKILMSPHAVLGPVDPQLGELPGPSLLRVRQEKPIDKIDDKTLVMADMAEKAIRQVQETVRRLLGDRYDEETRDQIARQLTEGIWTHDYPIRADVAKELGLPIETAIDPLYLDLLALYKQPVQRQPSVEYLPGPYRHVPERQGNGVPSRRRTS